MPAKSKHWGDIYQWLNNMIETCDDKSQKKSMNNLITNFEKNCVKPYRFLVGKDTKEFNQNIQNMGSELRRKHIIRFIWLESAKYAEERRNNLVV